MNKKATQISEYENYILDRALLSLCDGILIGTIKLYGDDSLMNDTPDEIMDSIIN